MPPPRLPLLAALLLGSRTDPAAAMLFAPSPRLGPAGAAYGLWDQTGLVAPDGTWRMWYDAQGVACNLPSASAVRAQPTRLASGSAESTQPTAHANRLE